MKTSRGFTLIELLIVTVVIVTLMGIVFRLAGTGGESSARAKTLARLQKLSNALSGYYAAFGSYPPVPLQGRSRDIYTRVDGSGSMGYGIQGRPSDRNTPAFEGPEMKKQIEAACRAQPVAAGYPLNPRGPEKEVLAALAQEYGTKQYRIVENYGGFNRDSSDWSENNVFMFGLMSFLLPRYQFMLDGDKNIYRDHPEGPWQSNNRLPFLLDGSRPTDWTKVQDALMMGPDNIDRTTSSSPSLKAMVENLPSQAVCARWMPNFAGIVATRPVVFNTVFFGVDTDAPHDYGNGVGKWFIFSQNGYDSEPSYVNGIKTVLDGWGEDFYYYSPPPYQSYQLWSSGPNKRTFPPWMEKPAGKENLVNEWISDDLKVGDK